MIDGIKIVIELFVFTTLFSIPLGIVIAFIRVSKSKIARTITSFYIWIMRGSPLLLQMMFLYYGLPLLSEKLVFDRMPIAIIAFSVNYAAYYAEIFRSGLESIDKGQFEAAYVLGFDKITMYRRIIFPQVIKRVIPPISNELITLVKDTSLVYILGLNDLLRIATAASNREASLMPFVSAGLIYLLMTAILTQLLSMAEKKFSYYS
ncbi:amino acid ABC transporter permease [Erysipelothrix rhusiopathiae]|uniref:amino acid ABC transporter permease n=1 Tax=Erysipelothrix rhusiopathiae TaxID=1648 RepID=UPI0023AF6111|nr:amino acid ABC transporter permease [Erysipelothrix rhusiopathiae]MDE8055271.1 amino acid ABC transporter permease [Erysipelothrix rhusiopathiae]MDE8092119.1 amino acid ABC transporter permease [Erysipelothrix rhusiopathiae]MDE8098132.1 amino acid ABC transporter permease [Erysipelothrix rhusiopathiae]MDE8103366.1 amino acid ABC transporter permease [Erysipelothrix rhusiopathiae]